MPLDTLPVMYTHSRNAWMTAFIFEDWFHRPVPDVKDHLRQKGLKEKPILLLDNCPAHPPKESLVSRCSKVWAVYLPKNTTSLIQPLDQGVISTFKRLYRKHLVKGMVLQGGSITDFLRELNLKDAIPLMSKDWIKISSP